MNVKRYFGRTNKEAMSRLRAELGDDAVVLKNQAVPGGVEILAMADDATVAETVYAEHAALLGAKVRPQWNAITRWPRAIPQYELGHLERLAVVAAAEARLPGLKFCANYRGGVSVGDCLVNGATTGESVAAWLGATVTA